MRPAARMGDPASHTGEDEGGTIEQGSANVEICGLPAARGGRDAATCALDDAQVIVSATTSVTVNGHGAAGRMDTVNCGGVISTTQETVWISKANAPAVDCMCPEPTENFPWSDKTWEMIAQNKDMFCGWLEVDPVHAMGMIGSMADEFNRSDFRDGAKDIWMGLRSSDPLLWFSNLTDGVGDLIHGSGPDKEEASATGWLLTHRIEKEDAIFYISSGYGSFKPKTAHKMFTTYPDAFEGIEAFDGLGPTSEANQIYYASMTYLASPEGAAHFGMVYIAHAEAQFEAAGIDLSKYSDRDRAGMLMTYYKQGDEFIAKCKDAVAEGRLPMAGEGCGLCLVWDDLLTALSDAGCGEAKKLLAGG